MLLRKHYKVANTRITVADTCISTLSYTDLALIAEVQGTLTTWDDIL